MHCSQVAPSHVGTGHIFDLAVALTAVLAVACAPTGVDVQNCSAKCQDQQAKCLSKCANDACRIECKTAFDNCLLSCGPNVSATTDSGPGAFTEGGVATAVDSGVALPVDASSTASPGAGSGAPAEFDSGFGSAAGAQPGR